MIREIARPTWLAGNHLDPLKVVTVAPEITLKCRICSGNPKIGRGADRRLSGSRIFNGMAAID